MQKITFIFAFSIFFALSVRAQVNIDKIKLGTGTGTTITLQSGGVSSSRIITIPDPGGPASLMLSTATGGQTINGGLTLGTPLAPGSGGTGLNTSLTPIGSLLYTSTEGTWNTLAPGNSTYVLTSNGTSSAPSWQPAAGGGVTTFSSNNLSPLFTTSVATPTSTPALSFTLSSAAAHTFLGNSTGSSAAPSYSKVGVADINATGTPSATTILEGDGKWVTPTAVVTHNYTHTTAASNTISFTDDIWAYDGTATSVSWTLPTAASYGTGHILYVYNNTTAAAIGNTFIAGNNSDEISNPAAGGYITGTPATYANASSGILEILISDGVSKWFINQ